MALTKLFNRDMVVGHDCTGLSNCEVCQMIDDWDLLEGMVQEWLMQHGPSTFEFRQSLIPIRDFIFEHTLTGMALKRNMDSEPRPLAKVEYEVRFRAHSGARTVWETVVSHHEFYASVVYQRNRQLPGRLQWKQGTTAKLEKEGVVIVYPLLGGGGVIEVKLKDEQGEQEKQGG